MWEYVKFDIRNHQVMSQSAVRLAHVYVGLIVKQTKYEKWYRWMQKWIPRLKLSINNWNRMTWDFLADFNISSAKFFYD